MTGNLPIVEKLVLQDMIKLILVKMNEVETISRMAYQRMIWKKYIDKPIATDLDIVFNSVCL